MVQVEKELVIKRNLQCPVSSSGADNRSSVHIHPWQERLQTKAPVIQVEEESGRETGVLIVLWLQLE